MRIRQDACIKALGRQVMAAPSSDGLGRREEVPAGSCGHCFTHKQVLGPQVLSKHSLYFHKDASRMGSDLDFVTCITPLLLCKSPWMMVIRMNPVCVFYPFAGS